MTGEEAEYELFTYPGAIITASVPTVQQCRDKDQPEIQLWGNRQGIASLANIFLWLYHNSEREFLSITGLSSVQPLGGLSLTIRVSDEVVGQEYGRVDRLDKQCQYEWVISDEALKKLALDVHRLASRPWHGYDIFPNCLHPGTVIHFRLTDMPQWLR